VTRYIVDVTCPMCVRSHRLANAFLVKGGPSTAGSLAELYNEELPPPLATLLNDKVWCDQAGEYIMQTDRRRVFLKLR
jgi:hypothetical protein